jgi:DNA-binding transcriptional MerR regulator
MSNMMAIGDVANALGVAPDTFRRWEKQGLLPLAVRRTAGGRRTFSAEDVEILRVFVANRRDQTACPMCGKAKTAK